MRTSFLTLGGFDERDHQGEIAWYNTTEGNVCTYNKGWEVHKKIERRSVRVLFLKLRTSSRSRSFFQA